MDTQIFTYLNNTEKNDFKNSHDGTNKTVVPAQETKGASQTSTGALS